jgi:hypothetical protein
MVTSITVYKHIIIECQSHLHYVSDIVGDVWMTLSKNMYYITCIIFSNCSDIFGQTVQTTIDRIFKDIFYALNLLNKQTV